MSKFLTGIFYCLKTKARWWYPPTQKVFDWICNSILSQYWPYSNVVYQGSPSPGLRTGISPWPVRNQAVQVMGKWAKLHLSMCAIYAAWKTTHTRTQFHGKIVFHQTRPWCQKDWGMLFHIRRTDYVTYTFLVSNSTVLFTTEFKRNIIWHLTLSSHVVYFIGLVQLLVQMLTCILNNPECHVLWVERFSATLNRKDFFCYKLNAIAQNEDLNEKKS